MEGKDPDMLNQESGDGSGSNRVTTTTDDDHSVHLPAFLAYLSLGFKVISTVIIVLMASWITITIKTTRSLHKTHNIFVAYLMVIDAIYALPMTLLSTAMTIGYFTGVGDFISCNVFIFMLYPTGIMFSTLLVMSIDKVIAITFPFKHREFMKPRVVCGILVTNYFLVVMIYARYLFIDPNSFRKVAKFGTCILVNDSVILGVLITVVIPIFLTSLITIFLDVFLTIKACKIRKQIQQESKLSGGHSRDSEQLKALKKKQTNIKKNKKPVITLLVVVMGNSFFGLLLPLLFIPSGFLDSTTLYVYESVVGYMISPNLGYVALLVHPFAYGLYFRQVREPMIRLLKRIICLCKFKSPAVAPQTRITWLNPV